MNYINTSNIIVDRENEYYKLSMLIENVKIYLK